MNETFNQGTIEVIESTMYGGKTEYLKDRKEKAEQLKKIKVWVFKPDIDTREDRSISGAKKIKIAWDIIDEIGKVNGTKTMVIIDEAQFMDKTIMYAIQILKLRGMNVIVAGLAKDFRGQPFGYMPQVMALSDTKINQLRKAVCYDPNCHEDGILPQRLRNGKPDSVFSATIVVEGSTDSIEYVPACKKHHVVKGLGPYLYKQKQNECP